MRAQKRLDLSVYNSNCGPLYVYECSATST